MTDRRRRQMDELDRFFDSVDRLKRAVKQEEERPDNPYGEAELEYAEDHMRDMYRELAQSRGWIR
jgi:hypothetical protein